MTLTNKNTAKFLNFRKFQEKNLDFVKKHYEQVLLNPVDVDFATGTHEGLGLLSRILPDIEQYAPIFMDSDFIIQDNFDTWMNLILKLIRDVSPWFHIPTWEGQPLGAIWFGGWQAFSYRPTGVEIAGLACRKVNPMLFQIAMHKMLAKVFDETDVAIVRAECADYNRAARIALYRVGFSHPETKRCFKIENGVEITGTIMSVTRQEWEKLHEE